MTEGMSLKPELGRYGVWTGGSPTPEQAAEIEQLGYGAIWVGMSPAAELSFVEPLLAATTTLQVATGIVNVWSAPAPQVAESFHRIEAAHPGRFLLGVGVGHREATAEYSSPYQALVDYLDTLDAAGVPTSRRVLAALGPVLRLAAERSAGAHLPDHSRAHRHRARTGRAVGVPGPRTQGGALHRCRRRPRDRPRGGRLLSAAVELRQQLAQAGLHRSRRTCPGSDRLIDAVVAHGSADDVAARLGEHLDAGADQVTIQVLGGWKALLPTLTELAGPLGLTPPD
ncbi:TIGR03620 family F420-dependent LLM class oxidoreductase [Mycolicibacter senuensis]|uniref:LLM class F420-dependent oxidoreductase n=1 Tax=Mycolicibacter senuensis TaxID=386913 RepID=A0A7I9XLH2_9MYCO|nr:TIGR03620 family F420-dependent LLM class oxidoreductase [Mycolicibacter senuensis]GFG70811.1 LLM class F420-dependent oxidoreductase [Mycolicibacter senuensis]